MGTPVPEMDVACDSTAESLLSALKSIAAAERRKHASVFNYWLSIRGDGQLPPIRDLDPLEISDAGPCSILLEMIGGGEDAEIRHFGQAIRTDAEIARISDAPSPSLLWCIAAKLPIVAATRQPFAFEESFAAADGAMTHCWVTLLPFSVSGTWIDYVYGFVSLDPPLVTDAAAAEDASEELAPQPEMDIAGQQADVPPEPVDEAHAAQPEPEPETQPQPEPEPEAEPEPLEQPAAASPRDDTPPDPEPAATEVAARSGSRAGFSDRFFETLASVGGFYGRVAGMETGWTVDQAEPANPAEPATPAAPAAPAAAPDPEKPQVASEGNLQSKLAEVRAKADEARAAKLRSNLALYEGLGAAYDFALDAEEKPEEYLQIVQAQGLKIQLRSPMAPVVKLAFDGMCDEATIGQLEAVLAWALEQELPRGSLAERLEAAGGIGPVLSGQAEAA